MADYDFQVILQDASNLPEDQYVNVLHFEVNAPDTVLGVAEAVRNLYAEFNANFSSFIATVAVKAYEVGVGPPVATTTAIPFAGGGEVAGEVAICLSYYADDTANTNKRRRGRIYLGPLSEANGRRPTDPGKIDFALDFGERLAQVGTAGNTTWKMYSKLDNAYRKIERIACDNAWDTQRRRGAAATFRTFRDVQ
jgi:hypothetical protein